MCGRFGLDADVEQIYQDFVDAVGDVETEWRPRFSLAPTDTVLIVRERFDEQGEIHRKVSGAVWDFRPSWRKPGQPIFNARLETVAEKPMFRDAFVTQRALIPVSGYFEWTGEKQAKTPHYIYRGNGQVLAAAGLWEERPVDGGIETSTVMMTRSSLGAAGDIHDRMPVFLPPECWDEWLNPAHSTDASALLEFVDRASRAMAEELTTHRVASRVNSVSRIDPFDPTLIDAVQEHQQGQLDFA